jgi:hypothetical protein
MRRLHLSVLAWVATTVAATAAASTFAMLRGPASTRSRFSRPALMDGAVYEVKVQVPSDQAEEFLKYYATWYLPVDQKPNSGRKLVSVLSREIGDEYNIIFLYWYESPYKENYYCKYAKAFFESHKDKSDFLNKYSATLTAFGRSPDHGYARLMTMLDTCQGNEPPLEMAETLGKFDQELNAMIAAKQDSWNFAVNPCFVMKLAEGAAAKTNVDKVVTEMKAGGVCQRSLLEQSVGAILPPPPPGTPAKN